MAGILKKIAKQRAHLVTVIRDSCITGMAVWVYRGPSKSAACEAYRRACKAEMERMRKWGSVVARRKLNILRMLSDCVSGVPVTDMLQPQQKSAARYLLSLANKSMKYDSSFYDHIQEERLRKNKANNNNNNLNY